MTTTDCMRSVIPVPFKGRTLSLVDETGEPFAVMKPIVEGMGLDWRAQATKLRSQKERWGVAMITTPSSGGAQKAICMPLRKLTGWLYSIDHNRVRNELRGKIVDYQKECDEVLWSHWAHGRGVVSRRPDPQPERPIVPPPGTISMPLSQYAALQKDRADLLEFKCRTLEARLTPRHKRSPRPLSEEDRLRILALAGSGLSRKRIGEKVGRSAALVSYIVRAAKEVAHGV